MKRRDFLKTVFGGAVAAVVLPELLKAEPVPPPTGIQSFVSNTGTYQSIERSFPDKWVIDPNCPPDTIYFLRRSDWQNA